MRGCHDKVHRIYRFNQLLDHHIVLVGFHVQSHFFCTIPTAPFTFFCMNSTSEVYQAVIRVALEDGMHHSSGKYMKCYYALWFEWSLNATPWQRALPCCHASNSCNGILLEINLLMAHTVHLIYFRYNYLSKDWLQCTCRLGLFDARLCLFYQKQVYMIPSEVRSNSCKSTFLASPMRTGHVPTNLCVSYKSGSHSLVSSSWGGLHHQFKIVAK